MLRPTLVVQTVYFHDSDRDHARALGLQLYAALTRPLESPLSMGAGIPVRIATPSTRVDLGAAENLVLIPALGTESYLLEGPRRKAIAAIEQWHGTLGNRHVLPVFLAENWRGAEGSLPGKPLLTELFGEGDRRRRTLGSIVLEVCRLLDDRDQLGVRLFVSHAKGDLTSTDEAATQIRDHVKTETTGQAFFDATDLRAGESLEKQLDEALGRGVFVAVRSDTYSSRSWCQRELLRAKQAGLPTLMVEVLKGGEARSYPYGGNGPSMPWTDAATIASRAMVEWLRARHFQLDAERIRKFAQLPDDTVTMSRPPELLDLAQGPLDRAMPMLVLHPDPQLSVPERNVLRQVRPRMRLVTPTTLYRRQLQRTGAPEVRAPLAGQQVAMSLSESPDVDGPDGFTHDHVQDVTMYLARCLISAGAAIAYGGDFRQNSFTHLLSDLVRAYNQTTDDEPSYLQSYLGATISIADAPGNFAATIHSLAEDDDVGAEALLPKPARDARPSPARTALYFSDMRRVMADHCFARIVLGGQAAPRKDGDKTGYGGRYPGVVEEAWRTLVVNAPLYVVGGFGGAARLVASLLNSDEIHELLREETFAGPEYSEFRARAAEIDADEYRAKLGLPKTMGDLARAIRGALVAHLASDETALAWNGLTVKENVALSTIQDPISIASLVMRGLLNVTAARTRGKVSIELVRGSVTQSASLDAVAVATFEDVPLGGAGAALDHAVSNRVSTALAAGHRLVRLEAGDVDADWVLVPNLGAIPIGDMSGLPDAVEAGAREVAIAARRHGFRRVGVVTFGANVVPDVAAVTDRMVRAFCAQASMTTFVWFEIDDARFEALRTLLAARDDVSLTTRAPDKPAAPAPRLPADRDVFGFVSYDGVELQTMILPPGGTAAAFTVKRPVTPDELTTLAEAWRPGSPPLDKLDEMGERLAAVLFGETGTRLLASCSAYRLVLVHDVRTAGLPFEIMRVGDHRPAIGKGMVRRPALEGLRLHDVTKRPPRAGTVNVLLVVNPTGDLPGTEEEARAVLNALKPKSGVRIHRQLWRTDATKKAVLDALADPDIDVFHYSGHAFFESTGPQGSGLLCANGEKLLLADLKDREVAPRVAFFNACQSARVRKLPVPELAQAFSEFFLRSRVEAYVGTFWPVGDAAAATFAATVYGRLADGRSLDAAVLAARETLRAAKDPDWGNYVLYGDGAFELTAT